MHGDALVASTMIFIGLAHKLVDNRLLRGSFANWNPCWVDELELIPSLTTRFWMSLQEVGEEISGNANLLPMARKRPVQTKSDVDELPVM